MSSADWFPQKNSQTCKDKYIYYKGQYLIENYLKVKSQKPCECEHLHNKFYEKRL